MPVMGTPPTEGEGCGARPNAASPARVFTMADDEIEENMRRDIVSNHLTISDTAGAFLDYAITQGNCLERAELLDDALPPMFRNYPYPLHSWPWFLAKPMRERLEQCVGRVPQLVLRAIEIEFRNDIERFSDYYGMPMMLAQLCLDSRQDLSQLMQRTDAVLTEDGLKIMEINVGSNIGGWQIQWMDAQYRKHPSLQAFFDQFECRSKNIPLGYMAHIIRNAEAVTQRREGEFHAFMLVDPKFFEMQDGESTIDAMFQAALRECGRTGALHFGRSYDELSFSATGVHLGDVRVSAVVSSHQGEGSPPFPQALYRAFLMRTVAWPDNPFKAIIGDKRSLALLYRHKDNAAFSEEERRMIEYFVPWSTEAVRREVVFKGRTADLEALLLEKRECFVIKVAHGAQGNDVHVGKYKSDEEWSQIVTRALGEHGWLVQEFCGSLPFYGQGGEAGYALHDVIWGVFGFGLDYGGCWLRLMRRGGGDGIINSARGAQETIVYEVAD